MGKKGPKLICLSEAFCWFVIPHIALRQKDAAFNAIFGMYWIKSLVTLLINTFKPDVPFMGHRQTE